MEAIADMKVSAATVLVSTVVALGETSAGGSEAETEEDQEEKNSSLCLAFLLWLLSQS